MNIGAISQSPAAGNALRLGVVGTGLIAHTNVQALLATGRVSVAALCNRTLHKGVAFAGRLGLSAPVFATLPDMLAAVPLDAVLLNTPHAVHGQQFALCAQMGLHILVEKPLGVNAKECEEMIKLRDLHGIRAAVCQTQRYLPLMRCAHGYMSQHREWLGRLRHITDIINLHYFHDQRPAWFFDPAQAGGGLLLTHGAHQVDRVHYLGGATTTQVTAQVEYLPAYPGLDSGYQIFGRTAQHTYTIACAGYPSPHTSSVQLDFEGGSVIVSLFANGMVAAGVYAGGQGGYQQIENPYENEDAYRCQFDSLLDAIEGKPAIAPTMEEATQVVRVLDAAKVSSQTGQAVAL